MQDDGVEPDPGQKAQREGQLVPLGQDPASDLDHGKFGRLRRVGRGRKDPEMSLDLILAPERVEQSGDGFLLMMMMSWTDD